MNDQQSNMVDQILYECRVISNKYDWDMDDKFKYIYERLVDGKSIEEFFGNK